MAANGTKALILITGATGHLGFRTLVLTLEAGFKVRIAIRKSEQVSKIKKQISIQPYLNEISFIEVPDITLPTAYDAATAGVDHILHIASPIPSNPDSHNTDWQQIFYDPAVKGTLSILSAASKTPSIKTVVITSSVVVLAAPSSNKDNRAGPKDLAPIPNHQTATTATNFFEAYRYSKILAHAAATDFIDHHSPTFKLTRILPGYIQGPNELISDASEFFSGSNEGILNAVLGNKAPFPKPASQVFLDDVARAHVFALDNERIATGDNLVTVGNGGDSVGWDEVAQVAARMYPRALEKGVLKPVRGQEIARADFDVRGSEEILGFRFAGTEEMVRGVVKQYLEFCGHLAA